MLIKPHVGISAITYSAGEAASFLYVHQKAASSCVGNTVLSKAPFLARISVCNP